MCAKYLQWSRFTIFQKSEVPGYYLKLFIPKGNDCLYTSLPLQNEFVIQLHQFLANAWTIDFCMHIYPSLVHCCLLLLIFLIALRTSGIDGMGLCSLPTTVCFFSFSPLACHSDLASTKIRSFSKLLFVTVDEALCSASQLSTVTGRGKPTLVIQIWFSSSFNLYCLSNLTSQFYVVTITNVVWTADIMITLCVIKMNCEWWGRDCTLTTNGLGSLFGLSYMWVGFGSNFSRSLYIYCYCPRNT